MSSADRVAHIDGQLMQYNGNTTRFQRSVVPKVIKGPTIHLRCFLGSVLLLFSAPPQILAASTVSSINSRNEEMMGDGFLWCYCCRFVLNSKRLLTHPVINRASAVASSIFHMIYSRCFEVRGIVCVEN